MFTLTLACRHGNSRGTRARQEQGEENLNLTQTFDWGRPAQRPIQPTLTRMAPVGEEERGTSKMKGIWTSPARAVTRTSQGKLAKCDAVMPNRLVRPAPNMSPVLLPIGNRHERRVQRRFYALQSTTSTAQSRCLTGDGLYRTTFRGVQRIAVVQMIPAFT
jgi:hypothetical protein